MKDLCGKEVNENDIVILGLKNSPIIRFAKIINVINERQASCITISGSTKYAINYRYHNIYTHSGIDSRIYKIDPQKMIDDKDVDPEIKLILYKLIEK